VLEREAELAVLACATIDHSGVRIGGQVVRPSSIVAIALKMIQVDAQAAEAAGKVGRAISASYSTVPDEALSQLIAAWGAALQIDSPDFRSVVFRSGTLENWRAFREFLGGALTGMGRTTYQSMREKAVESIVDMPQRQRRLALQAIQRIAAERRSANLTQGTNAEPVGGPPVGSPEWKQANAIFFIPPTALLSTEQELERLVHNWIEDHPLNQLPWVQVLGPNFDKLSGLVGPTFMVDGVLLSYAVLLGAAASREPKFFNCRAHKELESEFVKQNAAALNLGGMNPQFFGAPAPGRENPHSPSNGAALVETLQRIRTAAWQYADPKRPEYSAGERLARLTGATVLMREMVKSPDCGPFVFGLISTMLQTASANIATLVQEYREVEHP
jgi:hypothetical protein